MFIYALIDPDTNLIRYVGKTKNSLEKRLKQHIYKSKYKKNNRLTHKENWIRKLTNEGKKPIIKELEKVNKNNWKEREVYYISKYNNLTNLTIGGDNPNNLTFRKVAKLDYLSMEIIDKYESLSQAENENGVPYNHIIDSCAGRKTIISGYIWRYLNDNGEIIPPNIKSNRKKVAKLDLRLNIIDIYHNLESTGYDPSNVSSVCLGKTKTCDGYIWRYVDIDNNIIYPEISYKNKTVSKLDEYNNIIKIYENANKTHLEGYNPDLVIKVCRGINKSHKGFKWKFNYY